MSCDSGHIIPYPKVSLCLPTYGSSIYVQPVMACIWPTNSLSACLLVIPLPIYGLCILLVSLLAGLLAGRGRLTCK
jgi:hypothetical protein